jgi:hypothetical protein
MNELEKLEELADEVEAKLDQVEIEIAAAKIALNAVIREARKSIKKYSNPYSGR